VSGQKEGDTDSSAEEKEGKETEEDPFLLSSVGEEEDVCGKKKNTPFPRKNVEEKIGRASNI